MTLAQRLALLADRLRDVAANGLMFSRNVYDRENYRVVQDVAIELLAAATGEASEGLEALRAPIFSRPTPFSTGDAAVIDEAGRMLLVRRADNGKWAMPGGGMAVGETPAEGVAREVLEETGVRCEPVALVGIYDSRLRGTVSRHHMYQLVLLCRLLEKGSDDGLASHQLEVLECDWFGEDRLPEALDPGHVRPIGDAFAMWRDGGPSYFDPIGAVG